MNYQVSVKTGTCVSLLITEVEAVNIWILNERLRLSKFVIKKPRTLIMQSAFMVDHSITKKKNHILKL